MKLNPCWLLLLLLPVGCGHKTASTVPSDKPDALPTVQVVTVKTGTLEKLLPATGTLMALRDREATLSPPVSGVLDSLPIRYNQWVQKGQIIAHLSTHQLQGQIEQAQATLGQNLVQVQQAQANLIQQQAQTRTSILQAQSAVSGASANLTGARATLTGDIATLHNAEQALARSQVLFRDGLIAQKDVEAAELAVRTAQTTVETQQQAVAAQVQTVAGQKQAVDAARAASLQDLVKRQDIQVARQQTRNAAGALKTAQSQLDLYTIRAPLSGKITLVGASVGETVDTTTKLLTISDLSSLQLQIAVPTNMAQQIHPGQLIEFSTAGQPTHLYHTTVSSVASQIDPATGTVPVFALVPNPTHVFQDDATVKVRVVIERHQNILLVPQSAVLTDPDSGDTSVIVVGSDDAAHNTPVKIGLTQNSQVEILSGLTVGQKVATSGQYGLPDGAKVQATTEDKASGSGDKPHGS